MRGILILSLVWLAACGPAELNSGSDRMIEATLTGTITPTYHGLLFQEDLPSKPGDLLHIAYPGDIKPHTRGYDWEHFEAKDSVADLKKFLDEDWETRHAAPLGSGEGTSKGRLSRRFRLRGILVERPGIDPGTKTRHGNGFGYQGRSWRMLLLMEAKELN